MYGKVRYDLTKEEILKRVSYWDLWSYYIPGVELKKAFLSPLRQEDRPSANIFPTQDGKILFKDFKLGTFTIWSYLQEKYQLKYHEVLLMVNNDFNLSLTTNGIVKPTMDFYGIPRKIKIPKDNPETIIQIKRRQWNSSDREYWDQYYLKLEFITKRGVVPLQNFWINEQLVYWYNTFNPTYSYEFRSDKKRKIYSPYSDKYRFVTNADNSIWQGEEYLPWIDETLIITKSYKDVLAISNMKFNSVAPQSESFLFDEIKMTSYKKRFNKIYLLYDNDETGRKYSKLNCDKHDLIPIFIPENSNCKDITDFIKINGYDNSINLIKNIIKQ